VLGSSASVRVCSRQSCAHIFGVWLRFVEPERESSELDYPADERLHLFSALCLCVLVAGRVVIRTVKLRRFGCDLFRKMSRAL
jgi:hypothetical protein